MSRLTASPFHKPSPFESPRPPLSPPETNVDPIAPAQMPMSMTAEGGLNSDHVDPPLVPPASSLETSGARLRRVSTLAYHNSGLLESRERTVQRSSKSFIVVIPPSAFLQEHGQLGHTLSLGPRHRLSEGLLMPLFPTMYGQLTAIAREFNFPSTTGLCLYLHFMDNGIAAIPRISDDSWQLIWSHVFESSTPTPSQRPPISGKIEFDIDLRQARWYASWIASAHTAHIEVPMSMSSASPAITFRENRTPVTGGGNQLDSHPITQQSGISAPAPRHVPKKLSLVDRFDSSSTRSGSRPASRAAFLSPPEYAAASHVLSPIFQEEEPKSAKHDLERRVNTWRAGASLTPTPFAARGQTGLEPANMPNSIALDDSLIPAAEDELNLDDFAWSASSAGPNDYNPESPLSRYRLPSVHLANRMEGSVCLTPSDCTSFGPSDYTLPSPVPSFDRLPSPDLAHRMYEDSPPTPSTATSWGPPSGPASPSTSIHRPRSIHLGERGEYSRPTTPYTTTTWGAPLSYPPSPITPYYVHTPDAGQRAFGTAETTTQARVFAFPYYDPWKGVPWARVWPYSQRGDSTPWGQVWPHRKAQHTDGADRRDGVPWNHIWPYNTSRLSSAAEELEDHQCPVSVIPAPSYPYLIIYRAVYPHFDLYPAVPAAEKDRNMDDPNFNLYPSPHASLPTMTDTGDSRAPIVVRLPAAYPAFDFYPAIYPGSLDEIYPPTTIEARSAISVKLAVDYPSFDLCMHSAVYPYIMLYPPTTIKMDSRPLSSTQQTSRYRSFNFDRSVADHGVRKVSNYTSSVYPNFDLYPAMHPPRGVNCAAGKLDTISVQLRAVYPAFNLYPVIYPAFNIYPGIEGEVDHPAADRQHMRKAAASKPLSVRLNPAYPTFHLYPAIYPIFEIFPALPEDFSNPRRAVEPLGHPHFNLYPAINLSSNCSPAKCYPVLSSVGYPMSIDSSIHSHSDLYVDGPSTRVEPSQYPVFNLYPPVYPHFDLYPPKLSNMEDYKRITVKLTSRYPSFDLYPPIYPHFDLWPSISRPEMSPLPKLGRLTHAELHAMVMMEDFGSRISIYSPSLVDHPIRKPSKSHHDLHQVVFPASVVSTPSGTGGGSNSLLDVELVPPSQSHEESNARHRVLESRSRPRPRSGSISTRPQHSASSPSPIRRLPTPPTRGSRLSTAFELMSTLVSDSRPSPKRSSSNGIVSTSARPSPGGIETLQLEGRHTQSEVPIINRSASVPSPFRSETESGRKLDRAFSASIVGPLHLPARKRDSLVLQRVNAYNSSSDEGVAPISIEALSKFPMPPRPPLPPVPKALPQHKI